MEQNPINQKLMNLGSDHYQKIWIKFPDGQNLGSTSWSIDDFAIWLAQSHQNQVDD